MNPFRTAHWRQALAKIPVLAALACAFAFFALGHSPRRAEAEPWVSNRFAQNCAGCHAPGRNNLQPMDRRCTLSCQGCHVSPQGGGLRSAYGKWNEDRWLRSFRNDMIGNKKYPAPTEAQRYAKGRAKSAKMQSTVAKKGYALKQVDDEWVDDASYNRSDEAEKTTAYYWNDWLYRLPEEDPFRETRRTKVDGGADVRWQVGSLKVDASDDTASASAKKWHNFLMSADLALRWRPVNKRYHLVYEGRYVGSPTEKTKLEKIPDIVQKRSLYFLVDDLPYNTYVQAGYYRPMFGAPNPDHTTLSNIFQSMSLNESTRSFTLAYQALSVGGSPNVPFGNLHIMGKQVGAVENNSHRGIALNLGGRFVSFGASGTYSYWRSEKEMPIGGVPEKVKTEMHAFNFGGQLLRTTVNLELLSLTKDTPNDGFRQGGVMSLDTYTSVWRHVYGVFSYAMANAAMDLNPGKASQFRIGTRAFLYAGIDASLMITQESYTSESVDTRTKNTSLKTSGWVAQMHWYL